MDNYTYLNHNRSVYNASYYSDALTFAMSQMYYPVEYRILATTLHLIIFIIGVFGNIAVVVVVKRTKSLHNPTYCYLVMRTQHSS
jgi:hypothetical protein